MHIFSNGVSNLVSDAESYDMEILTWFSENLA